MLTIFCGNKNRICPDDNEICYCECSDFVCEKRCDLSIDDTCFDFIEDID
jgi:hypothetical protein